ncbi:TIGR04283 family arsenosugar biosynthesis glycosyltransferase [Pacificibacter marinus]|uniref:TIGR04283 family arsenosugar biosynthesis glycosyltransferase n=1 Tax=Pacificibacter marinus TaxID=658057 RepID=UPI001C0774E8|nr:TIGR04283 family arsenosugar biosynthesis glycosyltransferase [Pacificibacter marinus]MBU2868934.1 TIGR04283 family arsenosugar biosynthesis glycosyltransferase [Pacificibacter marinus]
MRAPISIIIPTLNEAPNLPDTLARVMEGLNTGVVRELVISDGGSTDDIAALAAEVGATFIAGPAGRGGQLARGAETAQGDWLLFLHADTWLPDGWSDAALQQIQAGHGALAFSLSFRSAGFMPKMTSAWANLRSRVFGLPYGDQALLISRRLYDSIGGYPDQPMMEDVAIARALKGQITLSPLCVQTDATRYQTNGWLAQGARNLWRLLRYLLGGRPEQPHRGYR